MTSPNRFEGAEEEQRAIRWMIGELQRVTGKKKPGQVEDIQDLLAELHERLEKIEGNGGGLSKGSDQELFERFQRAATGGGQVHEEDEEDDGSWETRYNWGEWELEEPRDNKLGYSKFLVKTRVARGGGSSAHYYSRVPPEIRWELTCIEQKSVTFFIGKARVAEIDAVCSVPQLPAELDAAEAGLRVLDSKRGDREWQRRIEGKRVFSIKSFIGGRNNIIANSAILYAPANSAFSITRTGAVTIDLGRFLKQEDGLWGDHVGKRDLRPIWLIDGQHRARGLSQSEEGYDLEIPIILFPPDFSLAKSAKIFAEINTLQKKLTPLHTLFMQHRFAIPSPIGKRDFQRPWSADKKDTWESRANHLSYECAAHLTSDADGPLYRRIRILDQNAPRFTIIQASQWVDFSRSWFLEPGEIYGPGCEEDQATINGEVENYFRAFIATCNHDGWDDQRPRWSDGGKNKGLVQRHGPSQALLKLYPTVWKVARSGTSSSPITVQRFQKVLSPLTWVDWLDERLLTPFGGSGERPRTALRVWMENAVQNGRTYPLAEVMSKEMHSQPGRGLLSSPGDGTLEVANGRKWPAPDKPVILRASQPKNTLAGSRWTILDSSRKNRSPENPVIFAKNERAELELEYEEWMDSIDSLAIRVEWYNTVTPPGEAETTLRNPARV